MRDKKILIYSFVFLIIGMVFYSQNLRASSKSVFETKQYVSKLYNRGRNNSVMGLNLSVQNYSTPVAATVATVEENLVDVQAEEEFDELSIEKSRLVREVGGLNDQIESLDAQGNILETQRNSLADAIKKLGGKVKNLQIMTGIFSGVTVVAGVTATVFAISNSKAKKRIEELDEKLVAKAEEDGKVCDYVPNPDGNSVLNQYGEDLTGSHVEDLKVSGGVTEEFSLASLKNSEGEIYSIGLTYVQPVGRYVDTEVENAVSVEEGTRPSYSEGEEGGQDCGFGSCAGDSFPVEFENQKICIEHDGRSSYDAVIDQHSLEIAVKGEIDSLLTTQRRFDAEASEEDIREKIEGVISQIGPVASSINGLLTQIELLLNDVENKSDFDVESKKNAFKGYEETLIEIKTDLEASREEDEEIDESELLNRANTLLGDLNTLNSDLTEMKNELQGLVNSQRAESELIDDIKEVVAQVKPILIDVDALIDDIKEALEEVEDKSGFNDLISGKEGELNRLNEEVRRIEGNLETDDEKSALLADANKLLRDANTLKNSLPTLLSSINSKQSAEDVIRLNEIRDAKDGVINSLDDVKTDISGVINLYNQVKNLLDNNVIDRLAQERTRVYSGDIYNEKEVLLQMQGNLETDLSSVADDMSAIGDLSVRVSELSNKSDSLETKLIRLKAEIENKIREAEDDRLAQEAERIRVQAIADEINEFRGKALAKIEDARRLLNTIDSSVSGYSAVDSTVRFVENDLANWGTSRSQYQETIDDIKSLYNSAVNAHAQVSDFVAVTNDRLAQERIAEAARLAEEERLINKVNSGNCSGVGSDVIKTALDMPCNQNVLNCLDSAIYAPTKQIIAYGGDNGVRGESSGVICGKLGTLYRDSRFNENNLIISKEGSLYFLKVDSYSKDTMQYIQRLFGTDGRRTFRWHRDRKCDPEVTATCPQY